MNTTLKPDFIFEVSWEVCNKVGGIYTVISTKALSIQKELKDNYILIGPNVWKETSQNPYFIEDKFLYKSWREQAESEGLHFKIGRWNIAGNPIAILIDFTPFFAIKDKIFTDFWVNYQLDSLSGQWDYMEPVLFGYAAAKVIESFYHYNLSNRDRVIAQFHEWMTGSGILHLKEAVPHIGTVFTTHATVMGRCIAGNGLPLYKEIENFNAEAKARDFNVESKHSLEKLSAIHADGFTTVSEITAKECKYFLNKEVDIVTPNGFEDTFVPDVNSFDRKRKEARELLFKVSETLLGTKLPEDTIFVANSGRYEFKNKGIDLFIDAMGKINQQSYLNKTIVSYILVPSNNAGPRKDLIEKLNGNADIHPTNNEYLTHYLHDADRDPSLKRIKENNLNNAIDDKVKIIFVPCYLNANDGIFNIEYYDLLIGFDVTVFPSYYEPWGYTPLESIAFHIPTVTTSLAGFGMWVKLLKDSDNVGVAVIERTDFNDSYVVSQIAENISIFALKSHADQEHSREKAFKISRSALWENLVSHYQTAYDIALKKAEGRGTLVKEKSQFDTVTPYKTVSRNKPLWKKVYVQTDIPDALKALQKIANNLWWVWNKKATDLFKMIDEKLWIESHCNPVAMLELLSYEQFKELEKNANFLTALQNVSTEFEAYMDKAKEKSKRQVAYFSMEYGLHDSIKIFSGGLGVLAGDYLKEASDSNANIVGIGLLYRYGYFTQNLSINGEQIAAYNAQKFTHIPIQPLRDKNGKWVYISIAFPGRTVYAKIWKVEVGRIPLYLLDTDIEENNEADRSITHQLYGGDWENRLKQELFLGVGGIRLLRELNIKPELYHCNEGHAAFTTLERLREYVQIHNLSFSEAVEVVKSSSLFTTHTPVPAGHDAFSEDLIRTYMPHYADRLKISWETFMNLGRTHENNHTEKFSMSVLAAKLSQEINGVSKIHGVVTRKMFNDLWDGYFPEELHITHVTNGVHYPTWVSPKWDELYRKVFGNEFLEDQSNPEHWKKIHDVPNQKIWEIRQSLRKELIDYVKNRLTELMPRRQENPKNIIEVIDSFNEKALTIGFARRFATYKRASLIFSDIERLSKIVNNAERPVQFLFAGKAHPNDKAGQDLIKHIIEISKRKEFIGKVTFVENYDMELASKLVQGVDIWLNTPTRPLEASGTSGEKAVMNGVVNFSVLDGWWAEGYTPKAGWALKEEQTYSDHRIQNELDAETIYNILEDEIIPTFYDRDDKGIPSKWISYVKHTISDIAPHFTMKRMLDDYYRNLYSLLFERSHKINMNDFELAKNIANWKKKVIRRWESIEVVSMNIPDSTQKPSALGEKLKAEVTLDLNELDSKDIGIEIVFGQKRNEEVHDIIFVNEMKPTKIDGKIVTYSTDIFVTKAGVFDFAFRIFPKNSALPHRQDFNLLKWI